MAEVEEPQFTSLSARIAALNSQSAGNSRSNGVNFNKRPPPPLPTTANRPPLPSRGETTNNPPISTYGSSVTKKASNQPIDAKGQKSLLPPPPIDRDQPRSSSPGNAKTPPLPARNAPPPLPGRKASQPSSALPPRKSSTQLVRRGSNSSTISNFSTISGISLSQTGSSTTSASSVDTQRKLPPALDQANLPPLPPTRRELEEKAKATKTPLLSVKSAPAVPIREPPAVERDLVPKMPARPSGPPRMPSRPAGRNNLAEEAQAPAQPPRKLPPPASARNPLTMGFNNKPKPATETETPNPPPRPVPTYAGPSGPAVRELTATDFDSIVMSGTPALVDFYAPYCRYCKELDPILQQLGEKFAFSDKVVIAKCDVNAYKTFLNRFDIKGYPTIMYFDGNNETPDKYPYMRELDPLTNYLEEKTGINAADGAAMAAVPPPINKSSKPSMAQVKAIQSRPVPTAPQQSGCLICRDFSRPDQVATQYPRQSLPRGGDMTGYLADVLCGPFTSATDKARAIFTWLHHNIAYDTVSFFGNAVKHVDPKDTITSGLAVCGGYAGLFSAIALKAGMEAVMVTGHGKGYGYKALQPGEPVPPCAPTGHAWNAVRIDGGEWKLLDACWGAGNVGNQVFNKKFTASYFTMSNDDFGLKHFPADDKYFFRSDEQIPTWDEYFIGPVGVEPLQLFGCVEDHGLSPTSFTPAGKLISVNSGEIVRFQFSKLCEHWDHEKNGEGKPYCLVLKIGGLDGRKEDWVPFESNEFWWWADIPAKDLGAPGQKVGCFAVSNVEGKDARGMTRREYLNKKGKVGMGPFAGVCSWECVR